jgi:hypothetical protein
VSRPTSLCITCAAQSLGRGWFAADELASRLRALGFVACTAQQVGAWLGVACRLDSPPIERRKDAGWPAEYRVTSNGRCWLGNTMPGLRDGITLSGRSA